jgi:hypothetical protein
MMTVMMKTRKKEKLEHIQRWEEMEYEKMK